MDGWKDSLTGGELSLVQMNRSSAHLLYIFDDSINCTAIRIAAKELTTEDCESYIISHVNTVKDTPIHIVHVCYGTPSAILKRCMYVVCWFREVQLAAAAWRLYTETLSPREYMRWAQTVMFTTSDHSFLCFRLHQLRWAISTPECAMCNFWTSEE